MTPLSANIITFSLFIVAVSPLAAAEAIAPPKWDIVDICTENAIGGACPRAESDSRRALLDRWNVLPASDRQACTEQVKASGHLSYRSLTTCINDRALAAFEAESIGNSDL